MGRKCYFVVIDLEKMFDDVEKMFDRVPRE